MTNSERESIENLQSMMGGELEYDVARRVLLKHAGDIHAAASAILEGDRGEEPIEHPSVWHDPDIVWPPDFKSQPPNGALNVARPNTPLDPAREDF